MDVSWDLRGLARGWVTSRWCPWICERDGNAASSLQRCRPPRLGDGDLFERPETEFQSLCCVNDSLHTALLLPRVENGLKDLVAVPLVEG